jgi:hypothetical protein
LQDLILSKENLSSRSKFAVSKKIIYSCPMEDHSASPPQDPSVSQTPKRNTSLIVALSIFIIVLGVGAIAWKTNPNSQLPVMPAPSASPTSAQSCDKCVSALNFEPLENSTFPGFGFSSASGMYVISVDPEQPQSIKLEDGSSFSTVTVGLGESGISTSPDGQFVSYINKDLRLTIMTSDGKQKYTFPPQFRASMVGMWSPDSHRFIAYSDPGTILGLFEGMGPGGEEVQFEKGLLPRGYYLIDVTAGTTVPLTPINSFTGWVDQSRILTSTADSSIDSENMMIFDVDHFTLNSMNIMSGGTPFFSVQKTVNQNGTKWALTVWPSGQDPSEIYTFIANFPQLSGTVIAKGIRTQEPTISPDGKAVMFHTQDEQNGPRFIEFWRDGTVTRVGKGIPLRWLDNDRFIYTEMTEELSTNTASHSKKIILYNTKTELKQDLFSI